MTTFALTVAQTDELRNLLKHVETYGSAVTVEVTEDGFTVSDGVQWCDQTFTYKSQRPGDKQVAKGVELLDTKVPGWRDGVDFSRLNIAEPDECLLGQVFGPISFGDSGYSTGLRLLGLSYSTAANYGFCAGNDEDDNYINSDEMRAAWGRVLVG